MSRRLSNLTAPSGTGQLLIGVGRLFEFQAYVNVIGRLKNGAFDTLDICLKLVSINLDPSQLLDPLMPQSLT